MDRERWPGEQWHGCIYAESTSKSIYGRHADIDQQSLCRHIGGDEFRGYQLDRLGRGDAGNRQRPDFQQFEQSCGLAERCRLNHPGSAKFPAGNRTARPVSRTLDRS